MRNDERFVIDEIPVSEPEHQPIRQRVDRIGILWLRNAIAAAAGSVGRSNRHDRLQSFGGIGRSRPIHFHSIEVHAIAMERGENARRAARRQRETVQVRRHMAAFCRIENDLPRRARIAREHFRAVHCAKDATEKAGPGSGGRELVGHHVVGVGPDAEVRIIAEGISRDGKRVAGIGPCRIGRSGDRYTLIVRIVRGVLRGCELRNQPSVRDLVVKHHGIAVIPGCTVTASKTGPQSVDVAWAKKRRRGFGGAVERPNLITHVNRLNVLVVAN